jgi:B12-binding domain/radical SAM domain protein
MKALMVTPHVFSYGGLLIAGIMKSNGCSVFVTRDFDDIFKFLNNVNLIGLSLQSTSHLFEAKKHLSRINKKEDKMIVAGGPAVQDPFFASKIVPQIDVFVLGEGDETIVDIIKTGKKCALESVSGLALHRNGEIMITSPRKPPQLSSRPFPMIPASLEKQWIRGVNIYVETHRGCVGKCTFCQYNKLFGHQIRSRPINQILDEVKYLKENGIKKIAFSGGDMSLYGLDIGESYVELIKCASKIIGRLNLAGPDIRPERVTPEILNAVRKYTQGWIFLGIESGSIKILNYIQKNIRLEDIYSSISLAKEQHVKTLGSFMVGFINESIDDFLQTKNLIEELMLEAYSINIAEPIPTTPYWTDVKNFPMHENPLFKSSEIYDGLSIAEERALTLEKTIYKLKHKRQMPKSLLKRRIKEIHKEARRIKKIILAMKSM